jgi:hypothetical protein
MPVTFPSGPRKARNIISAYRSRGEMPMTIDRVVRVARGLDLAWPEMETMTSADCTSSRARRQSDRTVVGESASRRRDCGPHVAELRPAPCGRGSESTETDAYGVPPGQRRPGDSHAQPPGSETRDQRREEDAEDDRKNQDPALILQRLTPPRPVCTRFRALEPTTPDHDPRRSSTIRARKRTQAVDKQRN